MSRLCFDKFYRVRSRAELLDILKRSKSQAVHSLLELRTVTGLKRLYPADHAAGAPYEAGLLVLAQLIEGGHFREHVQASIAMVALSAVSQQTEAIRQIEAWVSANLSLANLLDYGSILRLARLANSMEDWLTMAALFREQENYVDHIYAALIYTQAPASVAEYLSKHPILRLRTLNMRCTAGQGRCSF